MKRNKLPIILLIVFLVLFVVLAGTIAVLYFTTDMFKSNDQLFAKYLLQDFNLTELLATKDIEEQQQFKQNNSYLSNGNLAISIQSSEATSTQLKATTNSQHDNDTKRSYSQIVLKNEQENLATFTYAHSSDVYAIKWDEVYQHYIGVRNADLKELAAKFGMSEEMIAIIPNSLPLETLSTIEVENAITEQDSKYLQNTYSEILNNSIAKEKYGKTAKTNLNIDGTIYQADGYTLTLNEEDIKQILANVLTKAKSDTATLNILEHILIVEGMTQEQVKDIDLPTMLENLLEELQEAEPSEVNMTIVVYQANGKTIRIQTKINNMQCAFDIVDQSENRQKVIFTIGTMDDTSSYMNSLVQISIEKNTSHFTTNRNVKILLSSEGMKYQATISTTHGNTINDTIQNTTDISIEGEDISIDISYEKTIEKETQPLSIVELKGSNTVIINNYPIEQLEAFFNNLGEKAQEELTKIVQAINFPTADISSSFNNEF